MLSTILNQPVCGIGCQREGLEVVGCGSPSANRIALVRIEGLVEGARQCTRMYGRQEVGRKYGNECMGNGSGVFGGRRVGRSGDRWNGSGLGTRSGLSCYPYHHHCTIAQVAAAAARPPGQQTVSQDIIIKISEAYTILFTPRLQLHLTLVSKHFLVL